MEWNPLLPILQDRNNQYAQKLVYANSFINALTSKTGSSAFICSYTN